MRLIRKAHLAPGHHECAYMSYKPSERDGTWIELLLADPAKVSFISVLNSHAIWLCSVGSVEQYACKLFLGQS